MNPRQRRGVLLMSLAAIGSVVVFVSIVGYVGSVKAEVGSMTSVLRLTQKVAAYDAVPAEAVEEVEVPRRWASGTMITSLAEIRGSVAATDLHAGSYLQRGMLVAAPELQPGQREIAIMIDAETGVAGKVTPGRVVDIYASFQEQRQRDQRACSVRVISQARVLQVGRLQEQRSAQNQDEVDQVVPITFALSTKDSLALTYAENFADKVRLALIGQGGETVPQRLDPVCTTPLARPAP